MVCATLSCVKVAPRVKFLSQWLLHTAADFGRLPNLMEAPFPVAGVGLHLNVQPGNVSFDREQMAWFVRALSWQI